MHLLLQAVKVRAGRVYVGEGACYCLRHVVTSGICTDSTSAWHLVFEQDYHCEGGYSLALGQRQRQVGVAHVRVPGHRALRS